MVEEKSLNKFIKLYKDRYGVELSKKKAMKKANNLLNLYRAVYKPASKINIKNGEELQAIKN
jgi:hypothetical protein